MRRFKRGDGGFLLQDVAQFVDAFEQAMFREAVDWEFDRAAAASVRVWDGQIDFDWRVRVRCSSSA